MKLYLIIGLGGFLGSVARYALSQTMYSYSLWQFPWGTFLCNVIGCLFIGIIYSLAERFAVLTSEWRLFLTVGFCGGFTTFSTFANEGFSFIRNGQWLSLSIYASLSVAVGIAMVALGYFLVKNV